MKKLEAILKRQQTNVKPYFIADIAANHDGSLSRAKELIYLAKEAGADAAKFQHFKANTIVSDHGFQSLNSKMAHQANWKKSVFETYQDAEVPLDWTVELKKTCIDADIDFFTTPYDLPSIDHIDDFVSVYKIGSGDLTYIELLNKVLSKNKPVLLATGASELEDVNKAVSTVLEHGNDLVLMQCNTNYTASDNNFKYINLNVLKSYALYYPEAILGLSDHTLGHATVLGAIALGAMVFEKHFTDDNQRLGPDHLFSMNPTTWRNMIDAAHELHDAMGSPIKKIEDNELDSAVVQRRCLRANRAIQAGETLTLDMLSALRPAPENSILPNAVTKILGKKIRSNIASGEALSLELVHD